MSTVYMTKMGDTSRERTIQQKMDRSDPVLFSRVRPAIQYRASTDGLEGEGELTVRVGLGYINLLCSLLVAATAAAAAAAFVNGYSAD